LNGDAFPLTVPFYRFAILQDFFISALVFAPTMLAAVKRGKWFSEINNLHGAGVLFF
jgi:hypothetical protein